MKIQQPSEGPADISQIPSASLKEGEVSFTSSLKNFEPGDYILYYRSNDFLGNVLTIDCYRLGIIKEIGPSRIVIENKMSDTIEIHEYDGLKISLISKVGRLFEKKVVVNAPYLPVTNIPNIVTVSVIDDGQ